MTQKELLYLEDAIGHEKSIIKICQDTKNNLLDERLVSFIDEEILKHQNLSDRLTGFLKEQANG